MKEIKLQCDGSSGNVDLEIAFAELVQEAFGLFKKKQASYGSGNISDFGAQGVHIRMNDKMKRLYRLVWLGKENSLGDEETLKDTFLDMCNYSIISQMCLQGDWPDVEK